MLPSAVVVALTDDDNGHAVGNGHASLNKCTAKMFTRSGKHENGVGVLYILLVLHPEVSRVLGCIWRADGAVFKPARVKLNMRRARANPTPHRSMFQF